MAWYNASWDYRIKVTTDNTKIAADIDNQAFLLDLSNMPADFFTNVQNGGADIRITKTDGTTELPREVVSCDTGNSDGEVWYKFTGTLSSSADDDIYVYYGNSGASDYAVNATYGAENVWTENYVGVYHLEGDYLDSTASSYDLENGNAPDSTSTGGMNGYGAYDFELANSDFIKIDGADCANYNFSDSFTIMAYIKPESNGSSNAITGKWSGSNANHIFRTVSGKVSLIVKTNVGNYQEDGATTLSIGTDYHVIGRYDEANTDVDVFVNGSKDGTTTNTSGTLNSAGTTGFAVSSIQGGSASNEFDGIIDEVMVVSTALSDNDISTLYENRSDNANFFTFGTQETDGGGATRRVFVIS